MEQVASSAQDITSSPAQLSPMNVQLPRHPLKCLSTPVIRDGHSVELKCVEMEDVDAIRAVERGRFGFGSHGEWISRSRTLFPGFRGHKGRRQTDLTAKQP